MQTSIISAGGWNKRPDLTTVNRQGEKVRIYEKPDTNVVIKNLAKAIVQDIETKHYVYEGNLATLKTDIKNNRYLIKEGKTLKLAVNFSANQPSGRETKEINIDHLSFSLAHLFVDSSEKSLEEYYATMNLYQTTLSKHDYQAAEKLLEKAFTLTRRHGWHGESATIIQKYYHEILLNPVIKSAVPNLDLIVFSQAYRYAKLANHPDENAILQNIKTFLQKKHPFKVSNKQFDDLLKASQEITTELKKIRDKFTSSFSNAKTFRTALKVFNQEMDALICEIIAKGQKLEGKTYPEECAIMVLGSLARQEMCLYSDLEMAVVVKKNDKKITDYFVHLFTWVDLMVTLVGETPIPARFFPFLPSGFSFDSAGNTPLGIAQGNQVLFRLINTPQALAKFQAEDQFQAFIATANALLYPRLLTGTKEKQSLFKQYQDEIEKILTPSQEGYASMRTLHEFQNMQNASVNMLVPDIKSASFSERENSAATTMLRNLMSHIESDPNLKITPELLLNPPMEMYMNPQDPEAMLTHITRLTAKMTPKETRAFYFINSATEYFEPQFSQENHRKEEFVIKSELYRLFQMTLDALALFYQIPITNSFAIVDTLSSPPIKISNKAATNLEAALTLAMYYRVKLQHFYQEEKETMGLNKSSLAYAADGKDLENLQLIYQILIPFFETAKKFITKGGRSSEFSHNPFFQHDFLTHGKALLHMGDLENSKINLERARDLSPNNPEVEQWLGFLNYAQHHSQEAQEHFKRALKLSKKSSATEKGDLSFNLGEVAHSQGDYTQALTLYSQAYELYSQKSENITAAEEEIRQLRLAKISELNGDIYQKGNLQAAYRYYTSSLNHLKNLSDAKKAKPKIMNLHVKLLTLALNAPVNQSQNFESFKDGPKYFDEILKNFHLSNEKPSEDILEGLENYCYLLYASSHKYYQDTVFKVPILSSLFSSNEKNLAKAKSILTELLQAYAGNHQRLAKLYREMGLIHLAQKNFKEAAISLENEVNLHKNTEGYVLLASTYSELKETAKAKGALDHAYQNLKDFSKTSDSYPEVLRNMAVMYAQLPQPNDFKISKELLKLSVKAFDALANITGKNEFSDCFKVWVSILRLQKDNDGEWAPFYADFISYMKIGFEVKKEDVERAIKILEKLSPQTEQLAHCYIVKAVLNQNDLETCYNLLSKALRIYEKCLPNPTLEKRDCLRVILWGVNQFKPKGQFMLLNISISQKILEIEKKLALDTESDEVKKKAFIPLLASSIAVCELADILHQITDVQLMIKLGELFYTNSQVRMAIQCFEKALSFAQNQDLSLQLGCNYMLVGDFSAARKSFSKITVPTYRHLTLNYALLSFLENNPKEGIQYCKKIIDLEASDQGMCEYTYVDSHLLPACLKRQFLFSEGSWVLSDRALAYFLILYYRKHLSDQSLVQHYLTSFSDYVESENNTEHLELLGYLYEEMDKKKEAVVCFQKVVNNSPEESLGAQRNIDRLTQGGEEDILEVDVTDLMELGNTCYQQGVFDNAIACFKDSLLLNENRQDSVNLLIGCAYQAQEKMEMASLYFEKILPALNQPHEDEGFLEWSLNAIVESTLFWYQNGEYKKAKEYAKKGLPLAENQHSKMFYHSAERLRLDIPCRGLFKSQSIEFSSLIFLHYLHLVSCIKLNERDYAINTLPSLIVLAEKNPSYEHYMLISFIYSTLNLTQRAEIFKKRAEELTE